VRFSIKDLQKDYKKTEEDIKAVQSVGQIIGEVMKQLDDERCAHRSSQYRLARTDLHRQSS
jgi:26S proteasome regulatory subunit T4